VEIREIRVGDLGDAARHRLADALLVHVTQYQDVIVQLAADRLGGVANALVQARDAGLRIQIEVAVTDDDAMAIRRTGGGDAADGQCCDG
jgi:hypothetical protein